MRVYGLKVLLASDKQQKSPDGTEPDEALYASVGGLEQSVDSFQKVVGATGLVSSDDAFEMVLYHRSDLFHELDLREHDANAKRVPGAKSINTTWPLAGKSNSTDLTDHGVPIPSADSKIWLCMELPRLSV